ncbi:MAG: DUF429 domain-containing protein [Thermoplasmata archaeon]
MKGGVAHEGSGSVAGIDLAGSERRSTGVALMDRAFRVETCVVRSDSELWDWISSGHPRLLVVDAPLSLPRGRASLDVRSPIHFRKCDRELRQMGIPFFPVTLGPMRMLTARGIRLRDRLVAEGYEVHEGYPGGAQDIWGISRKQAGVERLRRALRRRGCSGTIEHRRITHDELDAVTLALVGLELLDGRALIIGDPSEGTIVLPNVPTEPPGAGRLPLRRAERTRQPTPFTGREGEDGR